MSMGFASTRGAARVLAAKQPAKPEKCRKETRKRLKALRGPKAPDGFLLHPDVIERRWIEAKCATCRACEVLA